MEASFSDYGITVPQHDRSSNNPNNLNLDTGIEITKDANMKHSKNTAGLIKTEWLINMTEYD
jgi:hypothetical protein